MSEHLRSYTWECCSLILIVRFETTKKVPTPNANEGRVHFILELSTSLAMLSGPLVCWFAWWMISNYRWLFACWKARRASLLFIDEENVPGKGPNLPYGFGLRRSWLRRWTRPASSARVGLLSRRRAWRSTWAHQVQRSRCWLWKDVRLRNSGFENSSSKLQSFCLLINDKVSTAVWKSWTLRLFGL